MQVSPLKSSASASASGWVHGVSSPRKQRLVVSSRTFTCCWLVVVLVHVMCSVFTAALSIIHALVATPALFTYTASSLQIDITYLRLAARTFAVVSGLHVLAIGRILFHSIRCGRLCFRSTRSPRQPTTPSSSSSCNTLVATAVTTLTWPVRFAMSLWNRYFGIDGLFGLNGPHFDAVFHAREVLEILSQTYQAYITSSLISSQWINRFAVAIIFVGCVSTPIIHVVVKRGQMPRRVACLVVDTALDLCSSVLIPIVVLYENLRDFDWAHMIFPSELVFDHAWLARLIAHARLLYVWSYLDFLSTVILQLGVLGCILTVENGIVSRPRLSGVAPSSRTPSLATVGPTSPSPRPPQPRSSGSTTLTRVPSATAKRGRRRACGGPHKGAIFCAWGVFVVIAHASAQLDIQHEIPSCALGVNAWFSKRPGCAVVTIHCHRLGIAGSAHELTAILTQIERTTLVTLAIMHCPALVMPDILQEFSQLLGIEVTNATLVAWPMSAAIHRDYHDGFSHIFLGHVTLREFPQGLLHAHVPVTMNDFDVSHTNVTVLPESLGELWSNRL